MKPFISIIVPVYNGETTLKRCIDSILSQSFADIEVILIDDGSTDGSMNVISACTDERIKAVSKENGGVSSARNLGIELSNGKYVLFVDCDDELPEGSLEKYSSVAKSTSADVISSAIRVRKNGDDASVIGFDTDQAFGNNIFSQLLISPEKFGYAGGKMVKRSIIVDNGLKFDTLMKTQEDLSFLLDVYSLGTSFVFSAFEGYIYHIQHEERSIPLSDNIKNRVKAILLAENKAETDKEALTIAADRILHTVYSYLCYTQSKDEIHSLITPVCQNKDIKEALKYRTPDSKYEFIASAIISSNLSKIVRRFVFRAKIKKLIGR